MEVVSPKGSIEIVLSVDPVSSSMTSSASMSLTFSGRLFSSTKLSVILIILSFL